ncbi:MAG: SWIM zinc finger family protein, partial [Brachybacterium sp.]|nr:SWIM zinc finger family protein [Brachybacterium sp.]
MSIELRSRRGAVGTSWHAVALRDGAERLLGPARVGRGKADARAGRVQWLDVDAGAARGDVLDADGERYQARLELPAFREGDRQAFIQVAQAHPELPARLAAGEYPQQIEEELAASVVSLLPRDASELSHDCSCLDWPGPCRHVSALLYVLVEAVDDRPLLLLTLRGLALEDLVAPAIPVDQEPGTDTADGADGSAVAATAPPTAFDPARTDPARLAEVVGEEVAAVLHSF